jgi:drug/metabolite transporter (DMT)-like permease
MAFIGVNSVGGLGLLFLLLRRGAVNQVAALFFLIPPVTAVMDYLVLREPLTLVQAAGIVLAALGVYLATRIPFSARPAAAPRSCPTPCE